MQKSELLTLHLTNIKFKIKIQFAYFCLAKYSICILLVYSQHAKSAKCRIFSPFTGNGSLRKSMLKYFSHAKMCRTCAFEEFIHSCHSCHSVIEVYTFGVAQSGLFRDSLQYQSNANLQRKMSGVFPLAKYQDHQDLSELNMS